MMKMTERSEVNKARKSSRFDFVSRVRYVMHPDDTGEEFEGLASNVSMYGLSLIMGRLVAVGQEILITECILPYCRMKNYRVQWVEPSGSGTYKAGLVRSDDAVA
jgi:hypothetical protein